MDKIKPIKISPGKLSPDSKITAVEMGKLWATYMGNSMSKGILEYYLQHIGDEDIKVLLENGLTLSTEILNRIEGFFKKEKFPIPKGFTEEDYNLNAPRLFQDEFYAHYLKYAAKAGLSIYAIALPLVMREDIREFFVFCHDRTTMFLGQINNVLMGKGLIIRPPEIPIPEQVEFVTKQNFLNGFFGDIRPLHALEIIHLYDNIENNATSKALLLGFSQTAKSERVKDFLIRGKDITDRTLEKMQLTLQHDNLPSPSLLDHLVTDSKIAPFSDKVYVFHKVDMFCMKIRSFGNAIAVNGRRDIGLMYSRFLMSIGIYVEDGANILIDNGWMEQIPKAIDRNHLSKN
ncbi:DUF3231 family protein [Mesobacillus foraminis]|uniref:DUF3231 family protein n=1 Tax=Mesobacillus foraminis TaxID=279826 RepID=UPI001BE66501|nr:DUF3231 family protein [Mesobacillus foraminis]MBT2759184.1 DUF3231 family protein [Mesobacillus foraminis]